MYWTILFVLVHTFADSHQYHAYSDRPQQNACAFPAYPEHGNYTVIQANFDEAYNTICLSFTCDTGYSVVGSSEIYCFNGIWSDEIPKCAKDCRLTSRIDVEYLCKNESEEWNATCGDEVAAGTTVVPNCVDPYYRLVTPLPFMICQDGAWDNSPKCEPVCGLKLPVMKNRVNRRRKWHGGHGRGGRPSRHGTNSKKERIPTDTDLPWHVGIYRKRNDDYTQICGGSIVASNLIVTAAHCFWTSAEGLQPASRFAVGAGKLFRLWNESRDNEAQKRDVEEIVIPPRFWGAETNYQDDIALVFLATPLVFNRFVWPICLDFDEELDKSQLSVGRVGIVTGWGLTEEDGKPASTLNILDLPYVDTYRCIAEASPDYREYITSDKICAGHTNGTTVCRGDSGGGLAYPETLPDGKGMRYYLRGIASTAPNNETECNVFTATSFTQVSKHKSFITEQYNKVIWHPEDKLEKK